ncbi:UNVERIFIED_CONTAM: hypothetical protein HDU68_009039 [Siphonaria sp. JEL0065]|nr:hypothetical protein HDU68_009039 [Siphonaria sp. JEL0065]
MNVFGAIGNSTGNTKCFICNEKEWKSRVPVFDSSSSSSSSSSLEQLADCDDFLGLIETFDTRCSLCRHKPLVALVGSTGAGKSTLLNLLAGREAVGRLQVSGAVSLDFPDSLSQVSAGATSATTFPLFYSTASTVYVDFPGFFDNRTGALEFIQNILMTRMLTTREVNVVLVKSLAQDRDSSFLSFLNSGLMISGSCMVVLTKAKPKASTNWLDYVDSSTDPDLKNRLKTKFSSPIPLPCVKMLQPEYYNSMRDLNIQFLPTLLQALGRLTVRAKPLTTLIPPSPTIQKFAHDTLKTLRTIIESELSTQLEHAFLTYQFQPYNISAIHTLLCSTFETPEPILSSLKMLGMIQETNPSLPPSHQDPLTKYSRYWTLFHTSHLSHQESLTLGNFIHPTLLEKLVQITSNPPTLRVDIPVSMPLHAKLSQWTETRETFHLEYVSYKGQLQVLLGNARRTGDRYGVAVQECRRLVMYRLEKCGFMEEAWCLVARALQEVMNKPRGGTSGGEGGDAMEMDVLTSTGTKEKDWDFEFLGKLMNEDALRELLKLGLESRGSIGNVIMLLGGVGATGAAAAFEGLTGVVAGIGGGARAGIALEIGSATMVAGTLVTVLAVAAIANYVYVRNQRGKQLAEGGVIGLDFSEFGLEKDVWKAVLTNLDVASTPEQVATAIARIESLFKVYEEKFSWDLIEKRRLIDVRFLEMKDVKEDSNDQDSIIKSWINVVAQNQKLMHTIVSKLKGRAKNVSGCSFMEHSLVEEYRFFPVTASCCRYLSPSGAKRCIHCNNYFHDSQTNKQCLIDARAVLCKDRMANPEQHTPSPVDVFFYDDKQFPVVEWGRLPNSYKRESVRLSAAAYTAKDMKVVVDNHDKENNIRYFITVVDGVAYVVFRGTEPSSSQNWLQNVTFSLTEYEDCTFHSGYFRICQQILDSVWQRVLDLECSQVVFTGHSLGGALAHTLHLLCLLTRFETTTIPILSLGFGSPPPFGKKTIKFFDAHKLHGRFITFVNQGDPVPMAFKAVEYFEQQIHSTTTLSQDFRTALNIVTFIPKVMSAAYGYVGTFVFFDGSVRNMIGSGEQAILWNHEAVSKWLSLTKIDECAVERHHITRYQKFVDVQYPLQ